MSKLPARTGWDWLKQGFALFRQQPGILTLLLVANLLFSLLIGVVPLAGPTLAIILIPSFTIAVMQACNLISQGQRVSPGVLLTGFRQPALMPLCKLGLLYVVLFFALSVLMRMNVDEEFLRQMSTPATASARPQVDSSSLMGLLMVFALQALVLMALCFAAPLTYWKQMPVAKATFYSVFGVLGAARPMFTMLLSWFGLFMLACMVVVLLLSSNINIARVVMLWVSLLFVLVLQCAIFVAYRQIFGDPVPDAALPVKD